VVNFTTVACRISSRLKRYKNYKNRLILAKVIIKNKMSRFYGLLCTYVCIYVFCLSDDNFRKFLRVRKFIFAYPGIRVKFVYEGYRVKAKLTVAKRSQMPVHALINFRRQFSSVLARWCHGPRLAGGHALD